MSGCKKSILIIKIFLGKREKSEPVKFKLKCKKQNGVSIPI